MRVSEDVQILRIRRVHWLAAVRATYFENKQTANGGAPMLNSDGEQIDLLTQELERADNVDPVTTTGSISGGNGQEGGMMGHGGGMSRERTSSLAPTIGSDGGFNGTEHERLLIQNPSSFHPAKVSFDSPDTSGRNTPTLTGKKQQQMPRSENNTPATPPSLTDDGQSSKNRSLT